MTRFRPRRWLPLLHVLVLAWLALGLVLQPVFAAVGELHELAHDPSGMHAHDHVGDVDAELIAAGEQDEGESKTLHVLLHFSHCCGGTTALLPTVKSLPVLPVAAHLGMAKALIPPPARLPSPFKPPIFG